MMGYSSAPLIESSRQLWIRPTPELGLLSLLFALSMAVGSIICLAIISIPTMTPDYGFLKRLFRDLFTREVNKYRLVIVQNGYPISKMVAMAPSDEAELIHIVATAAAIDDRPSCFRFPRGYGVGAVLPFNNKGTPIEGMGEPLHNIDNVIKATEIMVHDQGLHFSPRKVTVSTSGLVPQLKRFLRESNCALAVSLNATTDAARNWIMPINRKYNLTLLLRTLREELNLKRNYKVIFEYVMLAGVNDSIEDAKRLIDLVQGIPCKINLITFNPHSGSQFKLTREEKMTEFRNLLAEAGCVVFLRPSRGTIKWLSVVSLASCTNTSNGCL